MSSRRPCVITVTATPCHLHFRRPCKAYEREKPGGSQAVTIDAVRFAVATTDHIVENRVFKGGLRPRTTGPNSGDPLHAVTG